MITLTTRISPIVNYCKAAEEAKDRFLAVNPSVTGLVRVRHLTPDGVMIEPYPDLRDMVDTLPITAIIWVYHEAACMSVTTGSPPCTCTSPTAEMTMGTDPPLRH